MENEQNQQNEINQPSKFKEFLAGKLGKLAVTIISALIIWGSMVAATATNSTVLAFVVAGICGYWGWRSLNRITPDIFLWMSFTGWIIYFFIKGALAVMIGVFVAPFAIGKKVANAVSDYATEE